MDIGPTELIVILVIVVLIFGPGRLVGLGSEMGRGIREFREGMRGDSKNASENVTADDNKTIENGKEVH